MIMSRNPDLTIDPDALSQMRERAKPETRWAVYQNQALDSATLGELRFLHVGSGCTFAEPPPRYPDTQFGTGWRHLFIGWVNLDTGEIERAKLEKTRKTDKTAMLIEITLGWTYQRALDFKTKHQAAILKESEESERCFMDVAVDLAEKSEAREEHPDKT